MRDRACSGRSISAAPAAHALVLVEAEVRDHDEDVDLRAQHLHRVGDRLRASSMRADAERVAALDDALRSTRGCPCR